MADDLDDKSLEPTPRRRQQAREAGQVPRSTDLNSAGMLLGGLLVLAAMGGTLLEFLTAFLSDSLGSQQWMTLIRTGGESPAEMVAGQFEPLLAGLGKVLLPPLVLVTLLAVALNVVQSGFLFLPGKAAPDFSRINPAAGLRRIVSGGGLARLALGLVKLSAIVAVAAWDVYSRRDELLAMSHLDLGPIGTLAWQVCLGVSAKAGGALLMLALVDYGFQRWKHERDLKMTPQELREEMRNLQGDPQLAARRKSEQRRLATAGPSPAMLARADLVVIDPDRAAVALRYSPHGMSAPVVVAKGAGGNATRIRTLALERGVSVVESHALARWLLDEVDLEEPVADAHYTAVAEAFAKSLRAQSATV
jgi:flagellar biosynthetic protein FlhB